MFGFMPPDRGLGGRLEVRAAPVGGCGNVLILIVLRTPLPLVEDGVLDIEASVGTLVVELACDIVGVDLAAGLEGSAAIVSDLGPVVS